MTGLLADYLPLAIFIAVALFIGVALLVAPFLVAYSKPDPEAARAPPIRPCHPRCRRLSVARHSPIFASEPSVAWSAEPDRRVEAASPPTRAPSQGVA